MHGSWMCHLLNYNFYSLRPHSCGGVGSMVHMVDNTLYKTYALVLIVVISMEMCPLDPWTALHKLLVKYHY